MIGDKPADARTVLPGQPVTYHAKVPPLDRAARDFAEERGLDLEDAARVRAEQFRAIGVRTATERDAEVRALYERTQREQTAGCGMTWTAEEIKAPAGCIALGPPILAQPDPSKIVGVVDPRAAAPEPELPPIPEPGFYWARLAYGDAPWSVVEVIGPDIGELKSHVECIGSDAPQLVVEWGPKLEPPR